MHAIQIYTHPHTPCRQTKWKNGDETESTKKECRFGEVEEERSHGGRKEVAEIKKMKTRNEDKQVDRCVVPLVCVFTYPGWGEKDTHWDWSACFFIKSVCCMLMVEKQKTLHTQPGMLNLSFSFVYIVSPSSRITHSWLEHLLANSCTKIFINSWKQKMNSLLCTKGHLINMH